jgi:hypothetical protein
MLNSLNIPMIKSWTRGPLIHHQNSSTCHSDFPWQLLPFTPFGVNEESIVSLSEDICSVRTFLVLLFRDVTTERAQALMKYTTIRAQHNCTTILCSSSVTALDTNRLQPIQAQSAPWAWGRPSL